jgi:DNA replication licensing factor MCM2
VIYFAEEDEEVDERRFLDAEEVKGKLPQWIKEEETMKYIKFKFTKFLSHFKGDGDFPIYNGKIREMCIANKQSIEISYTHLKEALPTIAMWVGLEPSLILPELNSLAYSIACKSYTSYKTMFPEVFIKIRDLPIIDYIRDLRHAHLGKLIRSRRYLT